MKTEDQDNLVFFFFFCKQYCHFIWVFVYVRMYVLLLLLLFYLIYHYFSEDFGFFFQIEALITWLSEMCTGATLSSSSVLSGRQSSCFSSSSSYSSSSSSSSSSFAADSYPADVMLHSEADSQCRQLSKVCLRQLSRLLQ